MEIIDKKEDEVVVGRPREDLPFGAGGTPEEAKVSGDADGVAGDPVTNGI